MTGTSSSSAGTPPPPPPRQGPEEILRERFAKGEISEEEFRKRLHAIRESEGGGA
ncbi:MAG: SHOCT domain-containing protein [Longimicrobiales bacterium]